jgi:predicted CXXCH cytochrome family protein
MKRKLFIDKKQFSILLISVFFLSALFCAIIAEGGTYTSTKHAADADRGVIGAGIPYLTKGHCGQCHEQHGIVDGSEPTPPAAEGPSSYLLFRTNYGAYKNEFCYSCHDVLTLGAMPMGYGREASFQGRDKYENSIHNLSIQMLWDPDPSPPGPAHHEQGNCNNCHNPHGYADSQGVIPGMLFAREEALCEGCHDGTQGGAFKNIKAQLDKAYKHPTHGFEGRHTLSETGQPGGNSFGPENRHAECADCHNPHALGGNTHIEPGNAVSEVIQNVWGVEPAWPSNWYQPIVFISMKPPAYPDGSQYEYQICFKCHSYYGLGILANGVSTIIGPSNGPITDQAWEFNPNNGSGHPVVRWLNNISGSANPKALTAAQMLDPWTDPGNQTMYCSDCHGADNEDSGAKGPHGSSAKFMLKGAGKYWPTKSNGTTLWSLNTTDAQDVNLFCKNCHPIYGPDWKNNVHGAGSHQDLTCVTCHTAVPHGASAGRLIAYEGDPAPYNYMGTSLKITSFTKTTPLNYTKANCTTAVGCHQ